MDTTDVLKAELVEPPAPVAPSLPIRTARFVTALYCSHLFALGFLIALLGPIVPTLRELLGIGPATVSILFNTRAVGYVCGAFSGGMLLDRFHPHGLVSLALSLGALCMALIPLFAEAHLFWILIPPCFFLGIAGGMVDTSGNTMIIYLWRHKVDPYMQLMHAHFGIGALLAPILVATGLKLGLGLQGGLGVMAFTLLAINVPTLLLPPPPAPAPEDVRAEISDAEAPLAAEGDLEETRSQVDMSLSACDLRSLSAEDLPVHKSCTFANGRLYLWMGYSVAVRWLIIAWLCLYLGLYVGAEVAFGGWIDEYSVELGGPIEEGAYLTSAFWASLTVGRLMGMVMSLYLKPPTILMITMAGATASAMALWTFEGSRTALWVCSISAGVWMGPLWGSACSLPAMWGIPLSGSETGLMVLGAGVGEFLVPAAIGILLQWVGTWTFPPLLIGIFMVVAMVFAGLMLTSRKLPSQIGR